MEARHVPSHSSVPPSRIGRHEVVCLLGQGGMARVFLALQRGAFDAAKLVVVKQLRREFAEDQEFLAMFVDEARLVLRFSHPNVVHTYEVLAEAPDYCLVMEYLEGQTLSQCLRRITRERFPLDEQIWILSQVLAGLGYAHELKDFDGKPLGIVHRDVSPSNVFVTSSGAVKLLDFGIAKAAGAISFTRQGVVKGKLGYLAPEQCRAQPSDARSDLYAVGVMLWEAIAQRRRSVTETELAALRARLDDAEPAIEEVVPTVPPELAAICKKALAFEPDERFASASEFQQALDAYLSTRQLRNPAESVGVLLRQHFGRNFASVRESIEAHVTSVRTPTGGTSATGTRTASGASSAEGNAEAADASVSRLDFGPSRSRVRLVAAGGALAALALGIFLLSRGATSGETVGPVASPAAAPSAQPLAASANHGDSAAKNRTLKLSIAASPERAQLRLDGRRIENPYRAELPQDEREHELIATAAGHAPEVRRLRFDRDLELRISLEAEVAETKRGVRAIAPRTAAPHTPVMSTPAPPKAAAQPPASAEELKPGVDLKKRSGSFPMRAIDEEDPYSQ
jgi:eukaryotic-like serine/threonine-protein kinase